MKVRVRVRAEACMAKKQIIKDFALTPLLRVTEQNFSDTPWCRVVRPVRKHSQMDHTEPTSYSNIISVRVKVRVLVLPQLNCMF
jgi:hypothetical protein